MKELIVFSILLFSLQSIFCQDDSNFRYFDLIAQNNQNINESRNQKIINWNIIPFKMDGIESMEEIHFDIPFDTTATSDTVLIFKSIPQKAKIFFSINYSYHQNMDSLIIVVDNSFKYKYYKGRLVSQGESGAIMNFEYYPSGELQALNLNGDYILDSKKDNTKINYQVHFLHHVTKQKITSPLYPTINIESTVSENKCYNYKNIFYLESISKDTILNKEISICENGKMTKEVILDLHYKYKEKYQDFDYNYNGDDLVKKISNPDVQFFEQKDIEYVYDDKGNIKKIISQLISSEFEYDERNNVIQRIDFHNQSNRISKLWVRKINYIN